jgi:hypothetical protein
VKNPTVAQQTKEKSQIPSTGYDALFQSVNGLAPASTNKMFGNASKCFLFLL